MRFICETVTDQRRVCHRLVTRLRHASHLSRQDDSSRYNLARSEKKIMSSAAASSASPPSSSAYVMPTSTPWIWCPGLSRKKKMSSAETRQAAEQTERRTQPGLV
jgi:hypothetical protein